MKNYRTIIITASIFGILAVSLGAFGAHKLKELLSSPSLTVYQTGITYHFYHTLALLGLGIWAKTQMKPSAWIGRAAIFFTLGILLFSGSLYFIALKEISHLGHLMPMIGPITPIGGLCFIIGWAMVGIAASR